MQQGCQCFNCARLASCPKANKSVAQCKLYIDSKMTAPQIAKILGCHKKVILRMKQSSSGIKYLVKQLAVRGINVRVDKNDKGVFIWRKERFQSNRQIEAAQLSIYISLLAQSAQRQNHVAMR